MVSVLKQMLCCLILSLGVSGHVNDWEKKFSLEQSWENQRFLTDLNGETDEVEKSINELVALREQPVKKIHVEKRDVSSGSGSNGSEGVITKCLEKIDLGFILDRSGSIGSNNFEKMKSFVKDLTTYFKISQDYTRVSVISYASTSALHFPFSQQFNTQENLDTEIDAISYSGGGTDTDEALVLAYTDMFDVDNGARPSGAKQILIILTDGQSSGNVDQPAQQLKNIDVVIFAVGVGSGIDVTELQTMASAPVEDHVILLENFDEFSSLAETMSSSTCNATSIHVMCGKDLITVVLGRHELDRLSVDVDNMYLADGVCKASYNQTHVFVETPLNGCGTTYSESEQEMYYSNTLTSSAPIPGTVITRTQAFVFNFRCTYSRIISVGGFSFEPPKPLKTVEGSDVGNFTVALGSFKDDGFLSSSSETYPVFKSFTDRVNIEYGVSTSNPDIVVRAETCRATPSSKPYDKPQYEFITDGCDKDATITHHTTGLQQKHRFSIQVFRFLVNHTMVYVHCELRLCNINTQDSLCTRSTTCSNRKRRAAPFDATDRSYQLSVGPIVYQEKKDDEINQDDENDSSPNTILLATLACVALLVVVLAITVVLLIRKRRKTNLATSLEIIPMEYPVDKMEAFGISNMVEKKELVDNVGIKE